MTDDRRVKVYREADQLTQSILDETFLGGETEICTVGILTKTIYDSKGNILRQVIFRFSDRPKFVGNDYYEGRASFPEIIRTIGELSSPSLKYAEVEVELNNVDGFYNAYMTGGEEYVSFIGSVLEIRVGLREDEYTYFTIFKGSVPDEDGFSINRTSITIRAKDMMDDLNKPINLPVINSIDYPDAPNGSIGKTLPLAIGDWSAGYNMNRGEDGLGFGAVSINFGGFSFDIVKDSPDGFFGGLVGYNVGGSFFAFCIGSYTPDEILDCHIKRGNDFLRVTFEKTPMNAAGYWVVQIQNLIAAGGSGDTVTYVHQDGDLASISVKIPSSIGEYSNPILIAKSILTKVAEISEDDFDINSWNFYAGKSSPNSANISGILTRLWIGKSDDKIIESVMGLLKQVRVEMFWNRVQKLTLKSLHPDEFKNPDDCYIINQYHISEETIEKKADDRTYFNRAKANYGFTPILDKTQLQTRERENSRSINLINKNVVKTIDMPFIYQEHDALSQLDEYIRLFSMGIEYVEFSVAWTALLLDLGNMVSVNYNVGSINFSYAPMSIRDITFMPESGCLKLKLISLANFTYNNRPSGFVDNNLSGEEFAITNSGD